MKYLFFILQLLVFCLCASAQQCKSILEQEMSGDPRKPGWRDVKIQEFTYLPGGLRSQILYKELYPQGYVKRDTFSYDINGQCIEVLNQYLTSGNWITNERYLYTYDSLDNILALNWEVPDATGWANPGRWEYEYDGGKIKTLWHKLADGAGWVNFIKTSYAYDTNGNLAEERQQVLFKPELYTYSLSRMVYSYNANKRMSITWQDFDTLNGWVNNYQTLLIYNSIDSIEANIHNSWDENKKMWTPNRRGERYFSATGRIDSSIVFWFNKYTKTYLKRTKYIYTYADNNTGITIAENEGFKVYPNPASKAVTIETPRDKKVLSAAIMDINGREIIKITPEQSDVSALMSGVYILKICTTAGIFCQRLVIRH